MAEHMTLSVVDWQEAAAALRGVSGAVLVEAIGATHDAGTDAFLKRLEALPLPTVAVVGGRCDASALAVLATVGLGFVADDAVVTVDVATVLALGLTSILPAAIGLAPARRLLFGTELDATALRDSGLVTSGDPDEAAARLAADPAAALLARSFRVAARSSTVQARQYDAELRRIG